MDYMDVIRMNSGVEICNKNREGSPFTDMYLEIIFSNNFHGLDRQK